MKQKINDFKRNGHRKAYAHVTAHDISYISKKHVNTMNSKSDRRFESLCIKSEKRHRYESFAAVGIVP